MEEHHESAPTSSEELQDVVLSRPSTPPPQSQHHDEIHLTNDATSSEDPVEVDGSIGEALSSFGFPTTAKREEEEGEEGVDENEFSAVSLNDGDVTREEVGTEQEPAESSPADIVTEQSSSDLTPTVLLSTPPHDNSSTLPQEVDPTDLTEINPGPSVPHVDPSSSSSLNESELEGITPATSPSTTAPPSIKAGIPIAVESILPEIEEPPVDEEPTSLPSPVVEFAKQPVSPRRKSVMQKVVSMTRQRDLPPKSKDEEKKHLRELDEMLAASKATDIRRKSETEAATVARMAVLASALPTWETYILPNWRAVLRVDTEGLALRKLWWSGSMPVRFRGRLWGMCIGNGLALSRSAYGATLSRAKKGVSEGRYPEDVMSALLKDVEQTLPKTKLFQKDGVMHDDLVDLLLAYSIYDGEPRYPAGLSYCAAMILLNMPPAEAFLSLINLVNKSFLKGFYSADHADMDAYYRIFDTLLADTMPDVYANFTQETVKASIYLFDWLTTLFVRYLPLDLAIRIFDNFLLEGDSFLFRVALVILQILEPRLFNPVLSELQAVFKGEDRGAVAIVRREKGGLEEPIVYIEEVYVQMGCADSAIFHKLENLDWKEETWDRMVARELQEADI